LKNANIAAGGVLPMCQDTGTAIIMAKKGRRVWTEGGDYEALAAGVRDAYERRNLRYSQLAPISMFEEKNTRPTCPPRSTSMRKADEYDFLFIAKGGGSANKTFPVSGHALAAHPRPDDRVPARKNPHPRHRGLPALPSLDRHRRHSAEMNLKTVKLASTRYLDELPTKRLGSRATRSAISKWKPKCTS
jgi:fumarate hydratase class I